MFYATANKGFQIEFKSGYVLSCQFGSMNYCERRSYDATYGDELKQEVVKSPDCEVAIWMSNDNKHWVTKDVIQKVFDESDAPSGDSDVCGWVTPEQVAKIIAYLAL